jgi:AraC-like DNA-binding protein
MSSVGVPILANYVRYARARSISRREVCDAAGIREEELDDPERRFPLQVLDAMIEFLMRRVDDPALPIHLIESTETEDLGVMGFAVLTSESADEAIRRAVRYLALLCDRGGWDLSTDEHEYRFRWVGPFPKTLAERVFAEAGTAAFVHHMRRTSGLDRAPVEVTFQHPAPVDTRAHRRFFRSPIDFSAPANTFRFRKADVVDAVPRRADAAMNAFFVRYAEIELAKVESQGLVDRVRDAVLRSLASGEPSAPAIAKRVGMSERSLRRALAKEGTSFRSVVDELRRDRAQSLLVKREATIAEIAFLLGFADASAFSRAFRRWCGLSPQAYRAGAG